MPDLFILIPFNRAQVNMQADLPRDANNMANQFQPLVNRRIENNISSVINNINVQYLDDNFQVAQGDFLIVFAHGAQNDLRLFLNVPLLITPMADVITKLNNINANNAARILFMCCFSGNQNHIATLWKGNHPNQSIYGANGVISNLYSSTRNQIRSCCLALYEI